MGDLSEGFACMGSLEVGRSPRHRYGAYDPSPVVSSRACLASSTSEPGTSTSLGPADRKSGASKPPARWISDVMPASLSTPYISSATDSSGAAATFTHLSAMHASYPRLFTDARRNRSSPKFVRQCSRKLVHEEGPGHSRPGPQKPAQLSRDRRDDVVAGLLAAAASLSAHPAVLVVGGVPLALLPA